MMSVHDDPGASDRLKRLLAESSFGAPAARLLSERASDHDTAEAVQRVVADAGETSAADSGTGDEEAKSSVKEAVEPLLSASERSELHALATAGVRSQGLATFSDLYRKAVGPHGFALHSMSDDEVRSALLRLEHLAMDDEGAPPLLTFVRLLARQAEAPFSSRLDSWLTQVTERLGSDPAGVGERTGDHLVIEFRPDGIAADRFFTSVWLQSGDEHDIMLQADDEGARRDELPRLLQELLAEHHAADRSSDDLTIELILPRSLLGSPFDQFRITSERGEHPLGTEYPVVVRSLDRLHRRDLQRSCHRKWRWLRVHSEQAAVHLLQRRGEIAPETLYNLLLADQSLVGVAMPFPPERGRNEPDELSTGIQAGVPIAVWCREPRDPDRFTEEFRELLSQGVLALPHKVLELRRNAALSGEPDHLGNHLTLMFDDADRWPTPYGPLEPVW